MLFYFTQIEGIYVLFTEPKRTEFAVIETIMIESNDVAKESSKTKKFLMFDTCPNRNYEKDNLTCRSMLLHFMSIVLLRIL